MSHIGLTKTGILHSILCDEGQKYTRYFSIGYLPPRKGLQDCITLGCLEVSKIDDKEFYNPSKFYSPDKLEEAVAHLIAVLSAFKAVRYNKEPAQTLHQTYSNINYSRPKIASLTEKYYKLLKERENIKNKVEV